MEVVDQRLNFAARSRNFGEKRVPANIASERGARGTALWPLRVAVPETTTTTTTDAHRPFRLIQARIVWDFTSPSDRLFQLSIPSLPTTTEARPATKTAHGNKALDTAAWTTRKACRSARSAPASSRSARQLSSARPPRRRPARSICPPDRRHEAPQTAPPLLSPIPAHAIGREKTRLQISSRGDTRPDSTTHPISVSTPTPSLHYHLYLANSPSSHRPEARTCLPRGRNLTPNS